MCEEILIVNRDAPSGSSAFKWNGEAVCSIASTPFTASSKAPSCAPAAQVDGSYKCSPDSPSWCHWRWWPHAYHQNLRKASSSARPSPQNGQFRGQSNLYLADSARPILQHNHWRQTQVPLLGLEQRAFYERLQCGWDGERDLRFVIATPGRSLPHLSPRANWLALFTNNVYGAESRA